jgi:hypothetical protein
MRIYSGLKKYGSLLLLLVPFSLQAASVGEAADSLMNPVAIMTKLSLLACYIIGIALLLASIAQYKIHRQSPKLVPLTTPITLLLLGLVAIGIPYATNLFGESYSAEQQKPSQSKSTLVLPDLNASKGPSLPNSRPKHEETVLPPPASSAPESTEPPPSSGSRWTDDPEYNK